MRHLCVSANTEAAKSRAPHMAPRIGVTQDYYSNLITPKVALWACSFGTAIQSTGVPPWFSRR